MSGKKSGPMIEKLTSSWVSGNTDVATSPSSPLDLKTQSPRGLKNYDLGGVGLGIVAALEKSGDSVGEIQANKFLCSRNLSRSDPIPVNFPKNFARRRVVWEEMETMDDSLEDYTYVTCRGPDESYTRVYWDGGKYGQSTRNKNVSVFHISPARFADDSSYAYPTSDFLSSCHLCRKNLHGKDIYMYRGEKAFCSTECRYRQIVIDERKEQQCSSQASRSADVSKSPYTNENIFSTGILVS